MKQNKKLKLTLIILLIILISMISFAGIFIQNKNAINNILPEYLLGRDLKGYRRVEFKVNDHIKSTINYDENGQVISSEDTETQVAKTEEIKVNPDEMLTKENYQKSKKILEKRLNDMGVKDYIIRQNQEDGTIILELPENEETDTITAQIYSQAKFEIVDSQTNEVLMTNDDIKSAKTTYGNLQSGVTAVFLNIEFNKQGTEKFKNITNTYKETTITVKSEVEGEEPKQETTTKEISLKIDDYSLLTTHFDKEIANGILQLSVGYTNENTTTEELIETIKECTSMSTLLDSGKMPVIYELEQNKYIQSNISSTQINILVIITICIIILGFAYLIIKYTFKGILGSVSCIGYIAILLIALRYFNVEITVSGIVGIEISIIINYIIMLSMLKNKKVFETIKRYTLICIPVIILSIVFTFANIQIGAVLFWGVAISLLYNLSISNIMLEEKGDK